MVGTTRGLGWIGSNMAKVLHFDDYTTYNFKGPCKLNTRGIKIGVFRPIYRFIWKMVQDMAIVTIEDH